MSDPTPAISPETGGDSPAPEYGKSDTFESILAGQPPEAGPPTDASGDVTPAGETPAPGPVPYDRFQEVVRARQQLEQQLSQYQPLEPYQALAQGLAAAGVEPQQAWALLAQAANGAAPEAAEPDPEAEFHAYLQEQGLDPYSLDANSYEVRRELYEFRRERQEYQQERQQAERQQLETQVRTELQGLQQQHPMLQKPGLQNALLALFSFTSMQGTSLTDTWTALKTDLEAWQREGLATYSAAKTKDGQVPVTAGGSAPPPGETKNFHDMSPGEQQRHMESILLATGAPL